MELVKTVMNYKCLRIGVTRGAVLYALEDSGKIVCGLTHVLNSHVHSFLTSQRNSY